MKRLTAVLVFVAVLLGVSSPALAGGSPPPPPPPGPGGAIVGSQDAGTFGPGDSFTSEVGGFAPGSQVTVTINGQFVGTFTADSRGFLALNVSIIDCSTVNINGVRAPARVGTNTIVASGTSPSGAPVTQTVTFTIGESCVASRGVTRSATGGVAFTGANVVRWTLVALGAIALGTAFVGVDRRRRRAIG